MLFYVYFHFIPGSLFPFYIGKGRRKRAWEKHGRNKWWQSIVDKYGYEVRIVQDNLTEEQAFEQEKLWIVSHKQQGITLSNITDGGEGQSGRKSENSARWGKKHSSETRKKISERLQGRKLTQSQIDGIKIRMRGNKFALGYKASEETKLKKSLKLRGMKRSESTKKLLSEKAKLRSAEYYQRLRAARKDSPVSNETRLKLSESHKGHKHSLETRKKMSESHKKRLGIN